MRDKKRGGEDEGEEQRNQGEQESTAEISQGEEEAEERKEEQVISYQPGQSMTDMAPP
jgi:hypothetical protein